MMGMIRLPLLLLLPYQKYQQVWRKIITGALVFIAWVGNKQLRNMLFKKDFLLCRTKLCGFVNIKVNQDVSSIDRRAVDILQLTWYVFVLPCLVVLFVISGFFFFFVFVKEQIFMVHAFVNHIVSGMNIRKDVQRKNNWVIGLYVPFIKTKQNISPGFPEPFPINEINVVPFLNWLGRDRVCAYSSITVSVWCKIRARKKYLHTHAPPPTHNTLIFTNK